MIQLCFSEEAFFFFFFFLFFFYVPNGDTQCLLLQPSGSLSFDTIAESKINRFKEQGNEMVYMLVNGDVFFKTTSRTIY